MSETYEERDIRTAIEALITKYVVPALPTGVQLVSEDGFIVRYDHGSSGLMSVSFRRVPEVAYVSVNDILPHREERMLPGRDGLWRLVQVFPDGRLKYRRIT